ncbi:MAG: insulinase family protein [Bacillota bacterium]|nr:insulinase family protein [Bacillota bacterium]
MKYIQTKKFNEVNISVRCLFDLKKETITTFHVLLIMMKAKTEKYPNKQALSNVLSDTYGMRSFYGLNGYGKQLMLEHRFQYIHSSWINEDWYLPHVVDIMDQLLFHTTFDQESFEEAKYLLKTRLMRMEDDPDSLAIKTAFSLIEDSSISINVGGELADIDAITMEDVKNLYTEYLSKERYVFVCGDVEEEVLSYVKNIDCGKEIQIDFQTINTEKIYKKEVEKDISQTSLSQVYQTGVSVNTPDYYPLLVMNSVLGQSPSNLLFKEVREKNSLCYSISSSLIRFDGALMIHTGTFESALEQVQVLIGELIQRIANKDISEEDVAISKMDIVDGLISGTDNPSSLIQQQFLNIVLKRDCDIQGVVEKIQAVTLEDISRIAAQLRLVSTAIIKEAK